MHGREIRCVGEILLKSFRTPEDQLQAARANAALCTTPAVSLTVTVEPRKVVANAVRNRRRDRRRRRGCFGTCTTAASGAVQRCRTPAKWGM